MTAKLQVLVDLNVILDVVQQRQPFYSDSARVLDAVVRGEVAGLLAAHSIATLFFVVTRWRDRETAVTAITSLLDVFTIATVNDSVVRKALTWGWRDFEDAIQMAAALNEQADYLVTQNGQDFETQPVPVLAPSGLLALLAQK
ncbi:MAG: PIN domain-containing protein [Ardenticatenaceae bacterium]|nr:PIN domain-containing protein [Ardenticatenaceae bacterium]